MLIDAAATGVPRNRIIEASAEGVAVAGGYCNLHFADVPNA